MAKKPYSCEIFSANLILLTLLVKLKIREFPIRVWLLCLRFMSHIKCFVGKYIYVYVHTHSHMYVNMEITMSS